MKPRYIFLIFGLSLIAHLHTVWAQPALGIIRTNNQSLLYWPSNAANFVLEDTTNLASPAWVPAVDATPAAYGMQIAMTVTNSSAARFFRLFQNVTTADGMVLISAATYTIGDTLNEISFAVPTNVYISGFFMDTNLVRFD